MNNKKTCTLLLTALVIFLTAGCDEKSFGPKTRAPDVDNSSPVKSSLPTLTVGDINMPMPVPGGFRRIQAEDPLMFLAQEKLDSEEILLCLFERSGEAEVPPLPGDPLNRDTLQVSTLRKWVNAQISFQDFLQLKKPWQDESVVFNQKTLSFFEKAAHTYLQEQSSFTYNLGLIDSGPAHISFLKVIKYDAPGKNPVYVCNTTSLLWNQGKILRLAYNRRIIDFNQIQEVVAESVGYLQKMQDFGRLEPENDKS